MRYARKDRSLRVLVQGSAYTRRRCRSLILLRQHLIRPAALLLDHQVDKVQLGDHR
jgi:hypothetical protein